MTVWKLPFSSSDKFGFDVNGLAEGMDPESKIELADRHYAACDRRDKRKMLLWLVGALVVVVTKNLGWWSIPWL